MASDPRWRDLESPFLIEPAPRPADRERERRAELEVAGRPEGELYDGPGETEAWGEAPAAIEHLTSVPLGAPVGRGQTTKPDDVFRVQDRLRVLGMSWVPQTGKIAGAGDDDTDRAIRLFQSIIDGAGSMKGASGVLTPKSVYEQWLWSSAAPRWMMSVPAVRSGWCFNGSQGSPCSNNPGPVGFTDWLAEYLDHMGLAFAGKLRALRAVLQAFLVAGRPAMEQMAGEKGSPRATIAQRIIDDLLDLPPRFLAGQNPATLAKLIFDAIGDPAGRPLGISLSIGETSVPKGGPYRHHHQHQTGLEMDLRLFGFEGPQQLCKDWETGDQACYERPLTVNKKGIPGGYCRLLTSLAIECFLEHAHTQQVIFNDPEVRRRYPRVEFDKLKLGEDGKPDPHTEHTHDHHVHVKIAGAQGRALVPAVFNEVAPAVTHEVETEARCSCGRMQGETPPTGCGQVGTYIGLVQRVEAAYPSWTPEQVLNALRGLAGTEGRLFRALLSTGPVSPILPVAGKLAQGDILSIENMSRHSGAGAGIAKDSLGYDVALGHVLTGLSAGQHRNTAVGAGSRSILLDLAIAAITVDNLYALTIAGDLGQQAALATYDPSNAKNQPTVGPSTGEATDEELIGDLDGFLLGAAGGLGKRKVSEVLRDYYCVDACAPAGLNAAHRFSRFATGMSQLADQTARFAQLFLTMIKADPSLAGLTTSPVPSANPPSLGSRVSSVLAAFSGWLVRMASAEAAACVAAKGAKFAGEQLFEAAQGPGDLWTMS